MFGVKRSCVGRATGTSRSKWKATGASGPRTIRPSSNVSPAGSLSDRAAFHPGVQPLLPCGFCRGGASALCAQHGLLHSGGARLQDSLPEGVSACVFLSLSYPPFNLTWEQFHVCSFSCTRCNYRRKWLWVRRKFRRRKNLHVSEKLAHLANCALIANSALPLSFALQTPAEDFLADNWRPFNDARGENLQQELGLAVGIHSVYLCPQGRH